MRKKENKRKRHLSEMRRENQRDKAINKCVRKRERK